MRNAFRNNIRTFSIVVILGISIGLGLAMLVARTSVQGKIDEVKSSIGNTISVSPAGARGFEGGGEPITAAQMQEVATLANVAKVTETLTDRLTTSNTNLVSAIEPGTLGNRQAGNSGIGFAPQGGATLRIDGDTAGQTPIIRTFTPPLIVTGVSDLSAASAYGGDSVTYTSGNALDPTKDEDVSVVGKALAEKNNLMVGSTFTAYTKTITVVGIYDTGNTFSNSGLIMSLPALQRLSAQTGAISSAIVTVNSVDNIDTVTAAIKEKLGTTADVVNNQATAKTAVEPLESVKTISTFSLIGALLAGSVIILLTMVMIVRERRREIGVFKAIGASNIKIMLQFISEAVTLTALGLVAGLVIGAASASPITNALVTNSTTNSANSSQTNGPTVIRQSGPGGGLRSFSSNTLTSARNIQATVGWSLVLEGLAAAMLISVVGSAIPALFISKIRPAEVMRAE